MSIQTADTWLARTIAARSSSKAAEHTYSGLFAAY
jgi:hypothetical protein